MNYHETRIDSGSDISAERIPTLWVKEIPKLSEVALDEKFGGAVVEPRIKLMDDGLVANNAEDTN